MRNLAITEKRSKCSWFCHHYSWEVDIWQDDKGTYGHKYFMSEMTLGNVKVTIEGHKGQIWG